MMWRSLLVLVVWLLVPGRAAAFPDLAMRGDVRSCTSCHISPAGGGLLTEQGRDEAASSLSRGGDGRVFHGALELPGWLLVGGDFRLAGLVKHDREATEGVELAAFPMQADLRAAVVHGPFALVLTGGLRGSTRGYAASPRDYVISTEHYAMWSGSDLYARAGRFFPVQGLRLADHTLYVRRFTGTNLYEEPYAIAAGHVTTDHEVHLTAFVHDPLIGVGRREAGATLHGELHREAFTIGATARFASGPDGLRALVGASSRARLGGGLVALAELDVIRDEGSGTTQLAGFAGLDHEIVRGVQVLGWYEQLQPVVGLPPSIHHGVGVALELYPRAHWEIIAHTRWQWIGVADRVALGMVQLHYYL
jgi:hypothetical protein